MEKKFFWIILILLVIVLIMLGKLNSKIDGIDWDVRQILGKVAYLR